MLSRTHTVTLDEESQKRLEKLVQDSDSKNFEELVQRALVLMEVCIQVTLDDGRITIKGRDGQEQTIKLKRKGIQHCGQVQVP